MNFMLGLLRDLGTLVHSAREQGLRHTGRMCALAARGRWMAAADRRREAPFGVDTEGTIELDKLAIADEARSLGFSYVPSPGLLVDTLIFSIDEDLSRFSFVDFGSGKGRVLLVAAHYPFREVVGVEFSHELHGIAQINIINYKSSARRCQDIHSVCADAASFTIPEHACVLYFNNPFAEPIFARVLRNVQTAHERGHQKIYLLYQQLSGDLETDRTQNVAMLERAAFLREQQVRFRTGFTRFLLGSYELRIFETANSWRSIRG